MSEAPLKAKSDGKRVNNVYNQEVKEGEAMREERKTCLRK